MTTQILDPKEKLYRSLEDEIFKQLEDYDVDLDPENFDSYMGKVEIVNCIQWLITERKFSQQELLDIVALMLDEFPTRKDHEEFNECFYEFIRYHLADALATFLLKDRKLVY